MRTLLTALTCLILFTTPVVAGDMEDAEAQFSLGIKYHTGGKIVVENGCIVTESLGVSIDDAKAIYWLRKAAEQGLLKAQTALFLIYSDGIGAPKNGDKMMYWVMKVHDERDPDVRQNAMRDALKSLLPRRSSIRC